MKTEDILNHWDVIVGLVLLVGWFVRLEAKLMYLAKDHAELKQNIWTKIDAFQNTMTQVLQSLAKIEGRMENHKG